MSTIKRFWNNVVRPTLNDALDKFSDDERDDHHDDPAPTPSRDLSALEREVADQRRRLEEAERRLRAAQQPQSQPPQPPRAAQPRPVAQPQPAKPQSRSTRGGRDPFLEEAERELDEDLRRSQNQNRQNQQQPQPPTPRTRQNFSDDDAARWVAEQQAQRGQQARRPQGGPQPQRRSPALEISQHYAMLKLPNGSSIEQVKDSYRRLMREHHPDRFANDPVRHRQATELTQRLSRAFMELRRHLGDSR